MNELTHILFCLPASVAEFKPLLKLFRPSAFWPDETTQFHDSLLRERRPESQLQGKKLLPFLFSVYIWLTHMETLDPLKHTDYRAFFLEYLRSQKLSFRGFAGLYGDYVSFPFLSKLLRRDASGRFVREVSIRPEKLSALLKAMGLKDPEVTHLVLCRLENDQAHGSYRHASYFRDLTGNLKRATLGRPEDGQLNKTDLNFSEALSLLSTSRRKKVIEELKHQIEIEIERSQSELKAKRLKGILRRL